MEKLFEESIGTMGKGYIEEATYFRCLFCEETVEKGVIYPAEGKFFMDWRYMEYHIGEVHQSVFNVLLTSGRENTGLSEQQTNFLKLVYEGKTDLEIQKELQIGSPSTIRNHRFTIRKKMKQAKTLATLMLLLEKKEKQIDNDSTGSPIPKETFEIPKNLARYFSKEEGRLQSFQMKEYEKEQLLEEIARAFEPNTVYSESEVNKILETIYEDYMLLRREMVDRGFFIRNDEGSAYRMVYKRKNGEEIQMDFKKEMKLKAKEEKVDCGIFQIQNKMNQKIFVGSTPNFKTLNGLKFMLKIGSHKNLELQQEWEQFGEELFEITILETIEPKDLEGVNQKKELEKRLDKWLDKLQPFDENGYNIRKNS